MQSFCETVQATSGIAFRTYPDCLSFALVTIGVGEGTKVAVSPLSPEIYRTVLQKLGAEIVYVDIDKQTGCPDDEKVAQSGAEVLLLFEPFGTLPVRYNEQTTFPETCDYSGVKVIEDISQSIGSRVKDECFAGKIGQIVICAMEEESAVFIGNGKVDIIGNIHRIDKGEIGTFTEADVRV